MIVFLDLGFKRSLKTSLKHQVQCQQSHPIQTVREGGRDSEISYSFYYILLVCVFLQLLDQSLFFLFRLPGWHLSCQKPSSLPAMKHLDDLMDNIQN